MALEVATYISDLNVANPPGPDNVSQGDDHIRLIKSTLKATFPSITGPVTATQAGLNLLGATLLARSVLGNGTNAAAVPTAIQAAADGDVLRRSGTTVAFGQIAAGAIPAGIITDAMGVNRAAVSVRGRSANSVGVGADIVAAANGDVLRRTANVVGFGTIDTAGITDKAVTYAKHQDISATSRVLGRVTAGAGVTEELTLTQVLDLVGGAARGDVLFRAAAAWDNLAPGTAGQFLKTNGAGADPAWATVPTPVWVEYDKGVLASPGNYTQAHGLGAYPSDVQVLLECTTAESAWAVGDRMRVTGGGVNSTVNAGVSVTINTTNVVARFGNTNFEVMGVGVETTLTDNKWKVIFRVLA